MTKMLLSAIWWKNQEPIWVYVIEQMSASVFWKKMLLYHMVLLCIFILLLLYIIINR